MYFLAFHKNVGYKFYVTDAPWPVEKDGVYKKGKIYTLRIRTVKQELAEFFLEKLHIHKSKELLGIGGKIRIIPKKYLEEIYSITPIVIKNEEGYWRGNMTVSEFENRIKSNLIKKYKQYTAKDMNEDILLYDVIKINNRMPIKILYKNINLLGDKVSLKISNQQLAQDLAYFALGVGLGENNSRGCGFMNYKFL